MGEKPVRGKISDKTGKMVQGCLEQEMEQGV